MSRLIFTVALILSLAPFARSDDWPQWLGPQRDGVWREEGILEKFPVEGLRKVWDVSMGAGYAGPAVVGNRVFVSDRVLAEGAKIPGNAFSTANVDGKERLRCLNATTGKEIWAVSYPCVYGISYASGPRCTPTVDGDSFISSGRWETFSV